MLTDNGVWITGEGRHAIAMRLRALVTGQFADNLGATARDLGVAEAALRSSIDERSPYPTLDVLDAVVRHYGLDPTWVLTGEYNAATHRAALEGDRRFTVRSMNLLTPSGGTPVAHPTDDPRHRFGGGGRMPGT